MIFLLSHSLIFRIIVVSDSIIHLDTEKGLLNIYMTLPIPDKSTARIRQDDIQ